MIRRIQCNQATTEFPYPYVVLCLATPDINIVYLFSVHVLMCASNLCVLYVFAARSSSLTSCCARSRRRRCAFRHHRTRTTCARRCRRSTRTRASRGTRHTRQPANQFVISLLQSFHLFYYATRPMIFTCDIRCSQLLQGSVAALDASDPVHDHEVHNVRAHGRVPLEECVAAPA